MMRQQNRLFLNSLQQLCAEANKLNLHSSVLASEEVNITTVPFCLAGDREFDLSIRCKLGPLARTLHGQTSVLFIGHLPLVLPSTSPISLFVSRAFSSSSGR